jgi:hypothetical protein
MHAWGVHPLWPTLKVHDWVKQHLADLGYPKIEVHPMPGRCLRRPFGLHYELVTAAGDVLRCWQDEVAYFERFGEGGGTCSFEALVRAMLHTAKMADHEASGFRSITKYAKQWDDWHRRHDEVQAWLSRGFRDAAVNVPVVLEPAPGRRSAPRPEADSSDKLAALAPRPLAAKLTQQAASTPPAAVDFLSGDEVSTDLPSAIPDMRNGRWPFWLEHIAAYGLYRGLTIGDAARELAAWLWWVEGYDWPDKHERIVELLCAFARMKHNGHISRDAEGPLVADQIERVVRYAGETQTVESMEQFAVWRQARQQGRFSRNIAIEPLLAGACVDTRPPPVLLLDRSISKCDPKELPKAIEKMLSGQTAGMRKRAGKAEFPYIEFARSFLRTLWQHGGKCRINREVCLEMSGSRKPHTQLRYKQLLADAGLIEPDWDLTIRRHQLAALYKLTKVAMELFRAATQQATA